MVIVNPTFVLGPEDPSGTSMGLVRRFYLGRIPAYVEGALEILPCKHTRSPIAAGDVWYHSWQAGGGYGDPLLREPERVATDLALRGTTDLIDVTDLGLDRFDANGVSRLATDPIALPFPLIADDDEVPLASR